MKNNKTLTAWIFIIPALLVLGLTAGWPLLRTLSLSFTNANLMSLDDTKFIGFENFKLVLGDSHWWRALQNTLIFAFITVSVETVLGLAVAMILNKEFFGKGILRAAVLVPWAIPTVISAKMWSWMYHDIYGVVNDLALKLGFVDKKIAWLVEDKFTMLAVMLVDVWKTTPFMALMLLAGLQSISKEVLEAASLDSKSSVRVFFKITLPLLKPALLVAVIFRFLDAFRVFDLIYVLTSNKASTATVAVFARQQLIDFQEFGIGSAVSSLIFVVIACLTSVYLWVTKPSVV